MSKISFGSRRAGWLTAAAAGLFVSMALVALLDFSPPLAVPPALAEAIGYLVVFIPLVAAITFATLFRGQRSLARDFGFSATWTDVVLGVALGLALRVAGMWFEVAMYGIRLNGGSTGIPRAQWLAWVLLAVIAPIILAPLIEELFFRGLVLRGLLRWGTRRTLSPRLSAVVAIVVSSLIFMLVHLIGVHSPRQVILIGVMTFVVGCTAAVMAVKTGRLGASFALHMTYNATILIPALLA